MSGREPIRSNARKLHGEFLDLREVRAPGDLLGRILAEVELADSYFQLDSAIGPICVAYNPRGISAVMPEASRARFEVRFQERFGRRAYRVSEPPASLARAVGAQLGGQRQDLTFDLSSVSKFEQAVLRKSLEIPRGEVRPYAWLAHEIGHPRAVRAVGTALGRNPIPLLIPCHRVVRSDGELGQYALGPENKWALLEAEGAGPAEIQDLARARIRYVGSDSTKIYCFPTCRDARRVTDRHRQTFHSEAEAAANGYRPCQHCRPLTAAAS